MSFLGDLTDQISSQFSLGENTTTSLNTIVDGQQIKYGSLGDFASKFDQSAERRYVEEGYLRRDPYNTDPKSSEILWQEPNATVLVKKRMFSSIAENFRPDFMDADEKLYYRAMRILLQNKCRQIAALEKLSKIQQVTSAVGNINDQLVPIIITLADTANNGFGNGSNAFGILPGGSNPFTTQEGSSFIKTVDRLRVLYAYNQTNPYTTWITDSTNLYQSTLGTGTGVIEITNFTNISTTTTTDIKSPGRFSLSISDPYEAMLITDYDIEVALSDATNLFYNKKLFQFGTVTSNQVISDQQNSLNAIRNARNASPISFKVDPNTLLSKRLTVVIDRLGVEIPFTYDPLASLGLGGSGGVEVTADYLKGGNIAGYDGLDTGPGYTGFPWESNNSSKSHGNSELQIFQAIVGAIFHQLTLMANSAGNFTANNKLCNYARRKLRFNFAGKLIIQPMDVVSIYMNSKTQYDNKILSGMQEMFSGVGILQNITNTLTSLNNATDILFNPSANVAVQAEKSMYVGPNFPNYLWSLVRTQFVTEKEGTHVFGGVVESAIDRWSAGKFTVEVSGSDNSYYFRQGKINFKPGADAFNGLIFDPLTPFKSNFDSITVNNTPGTLELLDENKYLLSSKGSESLVKHKQGALAGEKATQGNYIQDQSIDSTTGRLTRVFYAPDGLVYKWKQGIGVFTQTGSSNTINDPSLVGAPNVYKEPFAGLDVMNVLSLLITGTPYNFATYYKATSDLFGFTGDPQSKQSSTYNFIKSLRTNLAKSNNLWGNFVPFKNLVMNEKAIAKAMQLQITITNANSDLDAKLKKFDDLQRALTGLGAINALSENLGQDVSQSVSSQIVDLRAQVANLNSEILNVLSSSEAAKQQFYGQLDTSADSATNYIIDGKNNPSDSKSRKKLRKQINYLTRRMSYDVRANQDKNLFIVDDYYDVDYDIAAFNKSLSNGIGLYSTDYTDVSTKISHVADLLNLEVFCDSQGHIRVRSPQYNRMPSSVFYRMLYLKQALGIQIFPQFLDSLFTDQLTSLKNNIEILEDQIRLDCAILGNYPSIDVSGDNAATSFLTSAQITQNMGGTFNFISDSTGTISNINNLVATANQEQVDGSVGQTLSSYDKLVAAGTSTKQLFGNTERYVILYQALQSQNQSSQGQNVNNAPDTSVFQTSIVQQLITRIETKSGQRITSKDYLTKAGPNQPIEIDTGQTIDLFKVTDELASYMQQWQSAVKLFYHTVKNAAEYKSLDDDSTTFNSLANPGLFKNSYIPEVYEHMIEDESYDDYGPGSGTRYVIKRTQIHNISIGENAPPYTMVEVHGTLPFFSENEGPPGLDSFPGGGNALVTALAIDYDMWRNYGYKDPYPINVPFLTDPVSQLGPYASMILSRNRHNILRGTITISGNEFMQPGEVIYLEDRNLLFYVTSVSHSINVGSGFTTTLDLSYGHSIGEYIPTVMDTIGKLIYKNQEATNTIIHRQDSSANEESLGVLQLDGKNPSTPVISATSDKQSNTSNYAATNQAVINNILYTTAYVLNANDTAGNNVKANVELRIYYDNNNPVNSTLQDQANAALKVLAGQSQSLNDASTFNQPNEQEFLSSNYVKVVTINLDDENDRRSPSQKAIDASRDQMANVGSKSQTSSSNPTGSNNATSTSDIIPNNNQLRTALFSYIIDCWVTFTQVSTDVANSSSATAAPLPPDGNVGPGF